ncbi:unnamed protein product [Prunus brigantina]
MRSAKIEINYLDFVESRYISNELKTLTKEKWVKLDKSEVVSSHPPVEAILITPGTKTIVAAPFKIQDPTDEPNKRIVEQNNYTNQSPVIVGKQLGKIETKIDKLLPSAPKLKSADKPLVHFQDLQPKFSLKTSSTMKKIEGMLEQLSPLEGEKSGLKVIGSSSFAIVNSDSESNLETDESSNISKIENAFKNLELESEMKVKRLTNKINPTSLTKNWYPKPTPPDIQFEERNNLSQFSVSSDKLYEWNIDGLSEQEIMNKLTHMSMVANSYITNHSLRQSEIVPLLETGFTGTLRSWWDKHLTDESRNSIIHAIKLNEDGLPLFDENIGRGIEYGVNTLLYTIVEHFVGTPSHTQARIHDQLSNLRCPQLSDFRWYKDVFISRVMLREDSNQAFWKEKFINGLPNLFAHKIRTVLSNELGHIDYDNLTYGNIISTINQEGMKMCIDMKINKQIQSERKSSKYELGNFCEQYGLISTPPSRKNKYSYPRHIHKQRKAYRQYNEPNDFYKKRKYSPKKRWSKAPRDKKNSFSSKTGKGKGKGKDKSKVKCFKCQKFGHYANDCRVKDAIRQLKITDEKRDNLIKVIELRNSESSENETMVSNSESANYESSDSQLSSPRVQLGCRDKCCSTLKQITVLTKQEEQEELLIDLISKIENPELKSEYLRKLRKIITQDTSTSHPSPVINLSSTLERFNKKKEVSLQDLHSESNPPPWSSVHTEIVKQIKNHVKTLPCLGIPAIDSFKIVETDASDIGYGGILKQKSESTPSEQIVRFHSGTTIAPMRPNYQSALVSSYDPFQLPPTATPMSSQFFPKSSPYVLKHTANLLILEPHISKSMSPAHIAEHHFPLNFHYLPHSPYKSLKFYREILHETQSVEIKPIRDKTDPTKIIYHSLYIHRVLSQKDWGSRPHELITLPSKYQYNYADYVESWYYIFLHQTLEFSHSWFINFDAKFRNELPYWFLHWWDTHGPKSDIFPPQVNELITYFAQKSKFSERDLFFPRHLLFITKYRIPWIMRWNYAVNWETPFFSRQFFVKWWDRFEVDRITEYVYRGLPQVPKPAPPPKHETSFPHSSETTLTVDGKSKAELQELAQQILLRASQMQDDNNEDTESQSSSSCQPGQQTPERPMRWSDYPHGQDPSEDYAEAYKAYDLNSD